MLVTPDWVYLSLNFLAKLFSKGKSEYLTLHRNNLPSRIQRGLLKWEKSSPLKLDDNLFFIRVAWNEKMSSMTLKERSLANISKKLSNRIVGQSYLMNLRLRLCMSTFHDVISITFYHNAHFKQDQILKPWLSTVFPPKKVSFLILSQHSPSLPWSTWLGIG